MLAHSPERQAHFSIRPDTPDNEDPETPSSLLPGHTIDHLSQSLHIFSQLEKLSVLDIHEVIISPTLFWPSEIGTSLPYWPNLTILRVSVNWMAKCREALERHFRQRGDHRILRMGARQSAQRGLQGVKQTSD
jgi:hypothetical protein